MKNFISCSLWHNKRALWYEQSINRTITVRKSKRTIGIILFHIVLKGVQKRCHGTGGQTMLKGLQIMTGKQIFNIVFPGSILTGCEDYSDNIKPLYTLIIIFSYGIKIYISGVFFIYMWVCNITIFTFFK